MQIGGDNYHIRKTIIIPTMLIIALMTTGALGVQAVFAQEDPMYRPLVERIADEFGLDEDQVEDVIQELREQKQAEMHARWLEVLDQAVRNGRVTEEQRQALIDKHSQYFEEMQKVKLLPYKERLAETQKLRQNFRQWADENGIDLPAAGLGIRSYDPMTGRHGNPNFMDGMRSDSSI